MANPPPLWPAWNDSQTDLLRKILTNIAFSIENGGGGGGGLPSQGGHAGEFLTTDGTAASWAPVVAGGTDNGYPTPIVLGGQTTITTGNYRTTTQKVTLSGAAGARAINFNPNILPFNPTLHTSGDKLRLDLVFPATSGLVLTIWQTNAQLVKLLPVETFGAGQNFTTDGNVLSACWDFVFDGAAWQFDMANTPA